MQVKKQQLELDMEQQTSSKSGKEYIKAVYCHPAYLTYMQSISWEMLDWIKHKLESRLLGEISITSDMQMTPPLWQKRKRTKEPRDESERREWKSWLKTQHSENYDDGIWSHHFVANRWGNNGNMTDFIFLGSKINADGDCSHEIKRHLEPEESTCLGNYSLIPPFSFRRIMLPREKGHRFCSITASELRRGIVPKLVRQHSLLILILRISDPGAPNSSWRKVQQ